jgi:uncharacterized membrane protein YeaQ/YmgE (transglycosylase-associated protein family)
MTITLDNLLLLLLVGLVAGFAATHLVAGHGYGLIGDIVVGVVGALLGFLILGTWLAVHVLAPLGIAEASVLGQIVIAFIGAAILLLVLRLIGRAGWSATPSRASGTGRRRWL